MHPVESEGPAIFREFDVGEDVRDMGELFSTELELHCGISTPAERAAATLKLIYNKQGFPKLTESCSHFSPKILLTSVDLKSWL